MENAFEKFDCGKLFLPDTAKELSALPWECHPSFDGVELKHIVKASDTDGGFSFHLVRVAPGKTIGLHTHENQIETHEVISGNGICKSDGKELEYKSGVIALIPAGTPHEVTAGNDGLYLFAKFFQLSSNFSGKAQKG